MPMRPTNLVCRMSAREGLAMLWAPSAARRWRDKNDSAWLVPASAMLHPFSEFKKLSVAG